MQTWRRGSAGQQIVASDHELDISFGLELAFRMLGTGRVVDGNLEALERVKKLLGGNETIVGERRIATLQGLYRDPAQHLTAAVMPMKAHTISVEKSKIVEECKFRHSLNSAISA
jgi:hypothetical protein